MDPSLRLRHDIAMLRTRDLHAERRALRRERENLLFELRASSIDLASLQMERRAIKEHRQHVADAKQAGTEPG